MCGIVGIKKSDASEATEVMLDQIRHRGPDDRGVAHFRNWTVGHVRLAVIDPEDSRQPMQSESSESIIVFNGEIYNFHCLKELVRPGFETRSDTEVILELYESHDDPAQWINKLDGMYAFAIVGPKGLLLARDPLGVKPLYIGKKDGVLVFGSEIKAVLTQTDRVIEFPPGHFYSTKTGIQPYYKMPAISESAHGFERSARTLRKIVCDSVRTRMISDVPLGAFLSGGLDSSIIAAIAVKENPKLKTFSVGLEGSPDIEAARTVANFLKTDHYERIISPKQAIDLLPRVIRHLESFDAALVRSAVPNYFLSEIASAHVKVALSGEGADELFAGYAYLKELSSDELKIELRMITQALHNTNLQRCDRVSMAHGLEVRVPFLDNVRLVEFALQLPLQYKLNAEQNIEKWILREAFRDMLPPEIVNRKKQKFADGAGLGKILGTWASAQNLKLDACTRARIQPRDSEEELYYHIFERSYPSTVFASMVGRSRSV